MTQKAAFLGAHGPLQFVEGDILQADIMIPC